VIVDAVVVSRESPLRIFASEADGRLRVELSGELDDATAPELQDQFADLTQFLLSDVVLNIGFLTFVDSAGLSTFVMLHKQVEAMGYRLFIFAPSPRVRRLFRITGLDEILNVAPKLAR